MTSCTARQRVLYREHHFVALLPFLLPFSENEEIFDGFLQSCVGKRERGEERGLKRMTKSIKFTVQVIYFLHDKLDALKLSTQGGQLSKRWTLFRSGSP